MAHFSALRATSTDGLKAPIGTGPWKLIESKLGEYDLFERNQRYCGSGKSTLGRIVLGLERPDSGMVLYQGRALDSLVRDDYRAFRRNVQVVFQNSLGSVNPRFTVAQIISEPIQNFESFSADRLAIMYQGRIVEQIDDLDQLDRVTHPACQELFDAVPAPAP